MNLPFCPYRYLLNVSYLGTKYHGSQRLSARGKIGDLPTIQETIERSLESFFPTRKCVLTAASRTDKGVHSLMNFYTLSLMDFDTPTSKIKKIANISLQKKHHDIIIKDVILVPNFFHPRRCCVSREYIYRVAIPRSTHLMRFMGTGHHKPANYFHLLPVTELYRSLPVPYLDLDKAQQVVELFNGEHDFLSFCFSPKPADKTIRTIEMSIKQEQSSILNDEFHCPFDVYQFRLKSHAFLYNQVRRMVGALISYACYGTTKFDIIKALLEKPSRNWNINLIIAEPYGLFLSRLNYDKSSFMGSIRTHEDGEKEEVDTDELEGSTDETMSDDQKESVARHQQLMIENFLSKQSAETMQENKLAKLSD